MFEYFEQNPQIIVNGFIRAGISSALDGKDVESDVEDTEESSNSDELEGASYITPFSLSDITWARPSIKVPHEILCSAFYRW